MIRDDVILTEAAPGRRHDHAGGLDLPVFLRHAVTAKPIPETVFFRHYGINQRGEIVCDAQRAGLMLKRPAAQAKKD